MGLGLLFVNSWVNQQTCVYFRDELETDLCITDFLNWGSGHDCHTESLCGEGMLYLVSGQKCSFMMIYFT